jgi:hypothetical protein
LDDAELLNTLGIAVTANETPVSGCAYSGLAFTQLPSRANRSASVRVPTGADPEKLRDAVINPSKSL